jgi:hypothetical protein
MSYCCDASNFVIASGEILEFRALVLCKASGSQHIAFCEDFWEVSGPWLVGSLRDEDSKPKHSVS